MLANTYRPFLLVLLSICCFFLINACKNGPQKIAVGEKISFQDIPTAYYIDNETNQLVDPYNEIYQQFRDRKAADLANPDAPKPFTGTAAQTPKRTQAATTDWTPLTEVFNFNWAGLTALNPAAVKQLKAAVKTRIVLNHPDLKIIELAIGPGGVIPTHAQAAPTVLHILEGIADVKVNGQQLTATVGNSIKLNSWAKRSITADAKAKTPLKALIFTWAPNGQQDYLSYGYYMTGCNFHAQPTEAILPNNFEFWQTADRKTAVLGDSISWKPSDIPFYEQELANFFMHSMTDKVIALQANYSTTPLVRNETTIPWLDFTKIKGGGFFWAKDAEKAADLLVTWNKIARMKGIFQAKQEKSYDFNMSYIALGAHGKYVTHSHATPEFYYVLGGETEWILDGEQFVGKAGDTFFHSPYWNHEMLPLKDGQPLRAITGSWAPFGDRSVFSTPAPILEKLPPQPASSKLPASFNFHNFKLAD
ncbi:MAG: cupin domain-containing protein [Saprospiraceae bacterium]